MSQFKPPYTLNQLAEYIDAKVIGDGNKAVLRLNTLQDAGSDELSFLANPKYAKYLADGSAGAVLLREQDATGFSGNALVCADPYLAYARLSALFAPEKPCSGVHPTAHLDSTVKLGGNVTVGCNSSVGANSSIGDDVVIGAGCHIGDHVSIAKGTRLHSNVTLYDGVTIGESCLMNSGVVVGSDGFGYAPSPEGWVKIHQLGSVVVGDRVEIGAGTTIDRGALGDTRIGDGVIIDNQVQIAHNVVIGSNTAIAGCVGIAGSTEIGERCTIAGGVGISGHLNVIDDVHIAAMTLVSKSITKAGAYASATTVDDMARWKKNAARFHQLDKLARRLSALEKSDK